MGAFTCLPLLAAFVTSVHTSVTPPCHVVTGSQTVRPGQLYVVAAHSCSQGVLKLTSNIVRSGVYVASATVNVFPGGITQIPLKVPFSVTNGDFKLTVEGTLKGTNRYFYNTTSLRFDPRFAAIVVQTNRPVYRSSQIVYFRILALQMDLKAYDDAMDISILDSDGFIMRRWLSVFTNNGILSMKFKLPQYVKEGVWKIRVQTYTQVEEQNIKVENYFNPYFEVFVEMPPYWRLEEGKLIKAKVWGMMTTQEYIKGNLSMTLLMRRKNLQENRMLWKTTAFAKDGPIDVDISLDDIGNEDGDLRLEVEMTDILYGSTSSGFAVTRLSSDALRIRFLTDGIIPFKLEKPFAVSIAIETHSGHSVPPGIIEGSTLALEIEENLAGGSVDRKGPIKVFPVNLLEELDNIVFTDSYSIEELPKTGTLSVNIKPSLGTTFIRLKAILRSGEATYEASVLCTDVSSPKGNIALSTSTFSPNVEEFSIFHLTSDVPISSFQYLVISKDSIVNGDEVQVARSSPTTTTFSVAMGPDMAPGFRLVVFATYNGTLMTDSIFLPMSAFNRYEMEMTMNNGKDLRGDSVEIAVSGDEGAYIVVNSAREYSYRLQAGNEMTMSRVVNSFMALDSNYKSLPRVMRRSATGDEPEQTRYHPAPGYGRTPRQTFALNGLIVFSDTISAQNEGPCDAPGLYYCNAGGCYNETQKCDGRSNCLDSTDEQNCESILEDNYDFAISRISRSAFLFDAEDGDWAWREIKKNDHEGIEFEPVDVPNVAEHWVINAFSVSPKVGFSILESPVRYSSKRGLSARLSGPDSCRRGEQLGLRLIVLNNDPTRSLVLVKVIGSPNHKFVLAGKDGVVASYSATLVNGDQHILVYIPGDSQERLDLPVVPTIEQGTVEIRVIASSQAGRADMVHSIEVLPEGAEVKRHTASVLDLRNRAFVLFYYDIPIEQSPIVPYQVWRRYVFGSPKCSISVTGGLLGPLLPPDGISLETTLDRQAKGTDARLYEFGMSIWTLHYRRLTSTLEGPIEVRERLEHANALYSNLMKRFDPAGYFINWDTASPSVWLTGWVLRVLRQAVYADWEYALYVDKKIFNASLNWIVQHQTPEGNFVETEHYFNAPLDRGVGEAGNDSRTALTAHVLIALSECSQLVEGHTKNRVNDAIQHGRVYLESKIKSIEDTYTMSIVVWALQLSESKQLLIAIKNLDLKSRVNTDGLPYWSTTEIPAPPVKNENQRPFRGPRMYAEGDSKAVEATSYALMAKLVQEGITPYTDSIALWLQNMRMTDRGFISAMDTLVAVQALTEYANRARLVDVTKMDVRITSPSDPSVDHLFHIKNRSDISNTQIIEMEKVWGHVNVLGRGAGLALVQLHMSYGVDDRRLLDNPPRKNFDLTIREFYSAHRNKSSITIEACTKWLKDEPKSSGSAVLEIDTPTGYFLVESEAEKVATSGVHPTLRDVKTVHHKTVWFFDRIPNEWHCFNHSIRRWFAVANMTLYRGATLYEANARESFVQILVNSTPLYTLSICEVCGSYQCPYCPFYNSTNNVHFSFKLLTFLSIINMVFVKYAAK